MGDNGDLEQVEKDEDPSKPTVVGIGASAGGLGALKKFFEHVPADSGLAFVVVVHLSPEHPSMLADLLQPHVRVSVQQVTETTPMEVNRVYVIPPNANLSAIDTHLRLSSLEEERRERAPIDHFFRTLAATHDGHAVGVVLTGTGSDGTLGIREIKAKGGVIIVQDPNEAEYDGMPQSAVATGMVDMILPVSEIPQAIMKFSRTLPRVEAPKGSEAEGKHADPVPKVLSLLRARTDRDFSRYKRATVLRRIARRMQLNYLEDFSSYLARIRENTEEAKALADDLLITVTSFFRDPEVFLSLEKQIIPQIFEGKGTSDSVRLWSVGCATGEEAYSLAMLLMEESARREISPRIQVFASDLHRHSLDKAREGFYPGDIETDVSPERLRRFFQKEDGGYRIHKEVRELVVFAPHNLLSDPPFSRLDLISCRNLLIYLEREVQREVVELFHYSLNPKGHLLLGSAEVVDASELFRTEDRKLCLYRKRNVPPPEPRLPVFPMVRGQRSVLHKVGQPGEPLAYGESHQRMVERYAPPSILVSSEDKVLHLSEHAGRYLIHPGGELTASVLKLVREELRVELLSMLRSVRETHREADSKPIKVQFNGHPVPVVMHLRPSQQAEEEGLVLIMFEEREPEPEHSAKASEGDAGGTPTDGRMAELDDELRQTRKRLQSSIEEFESSQEEMKASNEEMQSTNEELRSTLEELETSKEELQSINEELQTVNQENRHKVEELSQLSSDLHNLLSATDIATLFLDRELRILRFTPKLGQLFNVRQTDRGRPISDLTNRIGYSEMRADAALVLSRLVPIEREVQDESERWYLTRVLPYRTTEDKIEGVVITFVDITTRRMAEEAARSSEQRLAVELDAMQRLHALVSRLLTSDLTTALQHVLQSAVEITRADKGAIQLHNGTDAKLELAMQYGFEGASAEHLRLVGASSNSACCRALRSRKRVIIPDVAEDPFYKTHLAETVAAGYRAMQSTPLLSRDGRALGVLSTHYAEPHTPSERDLRLLDLYTQQAADYIERRQAEEEISQSISAQQASEQKYQQLFSSIDEGFCIIEVLFDDAGRPNDYRFLETNPAFDKNTGLANVVGKTMRELAPHHEPVWYEVYGRIARTGVPERFEGHAASLGRYYDVYGFRTGEPSQNRVAVLFRDVSERKAGEERQKLLLRELNHRVKNTLMMVQSIANQTLITAGNHADFVEKFSGRVAALAAAHDMLAHANWEGTELTGMLRKLLAVEGDEERIVLSGPAVLLRPQGALSLSLVVYELGTNARKYGALSHPGGRLRLHWSVAGEDGDRVLDLRWVERDGPVVNAPARVGFGTTLIAQALKGVGGETALEFDRHGISCRIRLPVPGGGDVESGNDQAVD